MARRLPDPAAVADVVYDVAGTATFVALLALIWTLSLAALQALITAALVAWIAGAVAGRLEKAPAVPGRPVTPRPPPRTDTVSEEEFEETVPVDSGVIERR